MTSTLGVYYSLTPPSLLPYTPAVFLNTRTFLASDPRCDWTTTAGQGRGQARPRSLPPKLSHFLRHTHIQQGHLLQTKPLHLQHNGGSPESLSFSLALGRTVTERRRRIKGGRKVTKIGSEPSVVVWSFISGARRPKGHLT